MRREAESNTKLLMKKVINRKARFKYHLYDRLEAGIILTGQEVKSVKGGRMSLGEAFVRVREGEVFLVNAQIPPYQFARVENYDPSRQRKLLAHKRQILSWQKKVEAKNYVIVPTAAYTKKGRIKVEIALAKGKKKYEKRESIRQKDQEREAERELKEFR